MAGESYTRMRSISSSREDSEIPDEESWSDYESPSSVTSEHHENEHEEPKKKCCDSWAQINEKLLVVKAFNFFFFAAIGSLFPYLSVFYKQIWLTARETGILLGMRPLIQLVATPMWGIIADTYSKGKLIFMVSLVGWLALNYSLSLVSPVRHLGVCKDNETIGLAGEVAGAALKHGSKRHRARNQSIPEHKNATNASHNNILENTFDRFLPQQNELGDLKQAFDKMKRTATELKVLARAGTGRRHPNHSRGERKKTAPKQNMIKVSRETSRFTVSGPEEISLLITTRMDGGNSLSEVSDAARELKAEQTEREFDFLNTEGHYPWPLDMLANYAATQGSSEWQTVNHERHIFTLLFLITFIGNLIAAPTLTLADTATLQALGRYRIVSLVST